MTKKYFFALQPVRSADIQRPVVVVTRDDFQHRFMIHVCKDGTVTYRDAHKRERIFNDVALPVLSVDTEQQAKDIQVYFCRRQYGEHPLMPDKPWYRLSVLSDGSDPALRKDGLLEIDDLEGIGAMFKRFIRAQRS